jgi:predicted lipid-binding transport protein (Tim44 family)
MPAPQVEAEHPTLSTAPSGPSSLPAVPRPDAAAEGTPAGQPAYVPPQPATGFLPDHPFISGLVGGLLGTRLGSLLYGGQIMGDESAAMIGYVVRMGVIVLLTIAAVRFAWRLMERPADYGDGQPAIRREPFFGRRAEGAGGGRKLRREPTFDDGRREPSLQPQEASRQDLFAGRRR